MKTTRLSFRSHFPARPLSRLRTVCAALLLAAPATRAAELLPPGHRPVPLGAHALLGGKVVVKPGQTLGEANIIIRDGLITAVGVNAPVPADARVWDLKGATVYAGFIDAYLTMGTNVSAVATTMTEPIGELTSGINFFGVPGQERDPGNPGPGYALARITPEKRAASDYSPNARSLESLREIGFTAGSLTPTRGILRGTSAFILLSDVNPNHAILKPDVFQHVAFESGGGRSADPNVQTPFPGSLMGVIAAVRQSFFDAQHYFLDHADYEKKPAGRRRPDFNPALEALERAVTKKTAVVFEPGSVLMVDRAARVAAELGVNFHVVASGQEWRRPDMMQAINASFIVPLNLPAAPRMPDEDDWHAVSLDTLRAWDWAPENPALLRSLGKELALTTHGLTDKRSFRRNLQQAVDRGLTETDALAAITTIPAKLCAVDAQLGTIEPGKIANLTVVEGSYFNPEARVREVWIDGRHLPNVPGGSGAAGAGRRPPGAKGAGAGKAKAAEAPPADDAAKGKSAPKSAELRELLKEREANSPQKNRGPLATPRGVLISGATVWTSAAAGRIEKADLYVADGKIQAVGPNIGARIRVGPDTIILAGDGWHITPGIVDCHSHSMILGGVNESTIPSSAMVRIGDVMNSETANIHMQLGGGVTAANNLHGSANPIGGQNAVIKLRDGASPEGLKFEGAPPGIKFALGENVKQSNWGDRNTTRFPQTRMGVPTFMQNRFIAAQQYLKAQDDAARNGTPAPRRDLELEAIGEILRGQRLIHCHSYRQDEIVAFLRTMEGFGVRVATLQHVLEGYKVADEIARHGAGGSCFSDWWAYKFEVWDAIPYAGSLMHNRGVVVSFNSDSSDLARRLNIEAAKAVKYGGTSETEALKFVTLNPAKQLRIDSRVGSLEPGKDADFAIWSKSPLDSTTVCLQTWIDGKKYFDRSLVPARTEALAKERADLVAKAKKAAQLGGGGGASAEASEADQALFFIPALEMFQPHLHDCLDCAHGGKH
jgi:imidazolonepropionase-like amidohydrolase